MRVVPGLELPGFGGGQDGEAAVGRGGPLGRQQVERARRGAIPDAQFGAGEIRQDSGRELSCADEQRHPVGMAAEQPPRERAVGGAAEVHDVLAADLLRFLQQPLHPRADAAGGQRMAAFVLAPRLLDLAEDLGLAGDLALEPAGEAQQEAIRLGAAELLVVREHSRACGAQRRAGADQDLTQAGADGARFPERAWRAGRGNVSGCPRGVAAIEHQQVVQGSGRTHETGA